MKRSFSAVQVATQRVFFLRVGSRYSAICFMSAVTRRAMRHAMRAMVPRISDAVIAPRKRARGYAEKVYTMLDDASAAARYEVCFTRLEFLAGSLMPCRLPSPVLS